MGKRQQPAASTRLPEGIRFTPTSEHGRCPGAQSGRTRLGSGCVSNGPLQLDSPMHRLSSRFVKLPSA